MRLLGSSPGWSSPSFFVPWGFRWEGCGVVAHGRLTELRATTESLLSKSWSFANLPTFIYLYCILIYFNDLHSLSSQKMKVIIWNRYNFQIFVMSYIGCRRSKRLCQNIQLNFKRRFFSKFYPFLNSYYNFFHKDKRWW